MTTKTPVILSDDNSTHLPLEHGSVLPGNSIPVSTENNNAITAKPDGLFSPEPTGLATVSHDYTLNGDGNDNPLSVRISSLDGNAIQTRQFADSSGGLYLWRDEFIQSVTHNNSLNGNGKADDILSTCVSNRAGNKLQLIDNSAAGSGGLYVPSEETIQYAAVTGVIICDGADDLSAEIACGKFGNGVYWKKKITLSEAKNGDSNILVYPQLISLPCNSDGTPVPYQLLIDYPLLLSEQTPYVYLYLICSEIPTHTVFRTTRYKAKIYRGVGITIPTGLDDIYDAANPGSGPQYKLDYMFSA